MAIETLGSALRQINRLFSGGAVTGFSDAQLLERFVDGHDGASFEALVARHGPMVLSVCRGILNDPNDAEDAFQATFLILVKKAGTFRGQVALGGWLYLVAHRVAIRANAAAARRRAYERQAGQMAMAAATSTSGPAERDEQLRALHEEIARLPEKLRLAVLLCDLQGVPQDRAAGELGLSERTLRRRLSEGRERLRARLGRRGLAPEGAMLGAVFLREARAAVPAAWSEAAVRTALATVNHTMTAGAVSAAAKELTQVVIRMMLIQKLKLVSAALLGASLMAWGASAARISLKEEPQPKTATTPRSSEQRKTQATVPQPEQDSVDTVGKFPVRGRVLDPDGKPVAGTEIYVRHDVFGWGTTDRTPTGQNGRVAVCDGDGQFRFELDKASNDGIYDNEPPWHKSQIAAAAPGFGLAWVEARSLANGDDATLRLVRDDVPINGRVLDTQGHPIAGVTVRLARVGVLDDEVERDVILASGAGFRTSRWYGDNDAIWPGGQHIWTSDADGRFEIKGVGRDRIARLVFQSPALEHSTLLVMARPAKVTPKPRPQPARLSVERMYNASFGPPPGPQLVGATFEHMVGPTKPITGIVRLKGTGRPLAGVTVNGVAGAAWTNASTKTDSQGRFRLLGLPKAELYQLTAFPRFGVDPFLSARINVTDTEGLKPIETTLELPRGVVVTGRLVDEATGHPVFARGVSYRKLPTNQNKGDGLSGYRSLTDPTFRLTVPPGEGMFLAAARGRETPYTRRRLSKADKGVGGFGDGQTYEPSLSSSNTCKTFNVPDTAEAFNVELKLSRGHSRRGRLLGTDGKPVTGARCYGLVATWGYIKTLADDTFEVFGLEPDHPRQLIFAHKDRRLVGSVILKGEDAKNVAPIEVRLVPAGSVKGRLVDEDGLPLSGATLSIISYDLDGNNLPPSGPDVLWPDGGLFEPATLSADADGRFQVDGLKPGIKSTIDVENKARPNYRLDTGGVLSDVILQHPGEVRDLGDVKVKEVPTQ